MSGRIVDGQSGQPLRRARVVASAREAGGPRYAVHTDQSGHYLVPGLQPGRYTLTVSKPGFVTLAYGQRRPRQPSIPVEILSGRHLRRVDVALPPGSVITGTIADEGGAPLPLATVRVLRYVYQRGQQQLVPAGTDRTDDRGRYRVFGLEPGDYYVTATLPRQLLSPGGRPGIFGQIRGGRVDPGTSGSVRGAPGVGLGPDQQDADPLGYALTYYPGVTNLAQAARVRAGLSAEAGGVDFAVRLVPTAEVSGIVFGPDGAPAIGMRVTLIPDEGVVPFFDAILAARVQRGGEFEIHDVPPGQYTLQAATGGGPRRGRGGVGGRPMFASQIIAVNGYDVDNLTLALAAGATLTGSIAVEATQNQQPGLTRIRITADALQAVPLLGNPEGRVDDDGTFVIENVPGGPRLVRARGVPDGLVLKAVYLDGQDVIDTPLEFGGVTRVDGLRLVFSDQITHITGLVQDRQGAPLTDFTVVAFPLDESLWQPQSRSIKASRPDQNGRYEIAGLPAGEYLLAAVDAVQQGEWFDPRFLRQLRAGSLHVSLGEGDTMDLNLGRDRHPRTAHTEPGRADMTDESPRTTPRGDVMMTLVCRKSSEPVGRSVMPVILSTKPNQDPAGSKATGADMMFHVKRARPSEYSRMISRCHVSSSHV